METLKIVLCSPALTVERLECPHFCDGEPEFVVTSEREKASGEVQPRRASLICPGCGWLIFQLEGMVS